MPVLSPLKAAVIIGLVVASTGLTASPVVTADDSTAEASLTMFLVLPALNIEWTP